MRKITCDDCNFGHALCCGFCAVCQGTANRNKPKCKRVEWRYNPLYCKGVVISAEDGMPVIGASIMVGGGQAQAITDENGCFQLSNVPANSKLKISYIGLVTTFATPSANMKVTLQSDSKHLDDVVVTGMFNRKKKVLRVLQ